jgi:hypothetical protein
MAMLTLIAAVLGAASAPATAVSPTNLTGVFQATCLDGQAKFRANELSAISFDQLPETLRDSLGRPSSGKVWQLNTGGRSYLYMLDYDAARPGVSPKVCGLASDSIDLKAAGDALEARLTGNVERNRPRSAQWLNAKDGYVATATSAAALSVLQISWMSEADKAAAQAQVEQLPR